uniref:Uncharacterized protein n=1 Tax=Anguilla anguilla TaxID=7936 RepID=A0A0E9WJT5_ANGAN
MRADCGSGPPSLTHDAFSPELGGPNATFQVPRRFKGV